jgi:polygalacturonase
MWAMWALILLLLARPCHSLTTVSVLDYGAVGDNSTDNTAAFRAAAAAVAAAGGGSLLVPAGNYKTAAFNLTSSSTQLHVTGTIWAVESLAQWPLVEGLPSYASPDAMPGPRYQALVWFINSTNVSVAGPGVINGAGVWWWGQMRNNRRPHIMEINNCTDVEVSGVTLQNSAFWTLRPVYCTRVYIHDMKILAPWPGDPGGVLNADGADIDSSQDVLLERLFISCGDDHVTVLAGAGAAGRAFARPSRNVTVQDCVLGVGMGLSIGSSVSGGVEDVTFRRNYMTERATDWGMGTHLKTRVTYGGHVRNIVWEDSVFERVSSAGMFLETDYQSGGECNATTCTEIRDIVWRNLTFNNIGGWPAGSFHCYAARPCVNLTWQDISANTTRAWSCSNVSSGSVRNVSPPGLAQACGLQ